MSHEPDRPSLRVQRRSAERELPRLIADAGRQREQRNATHFFDLANQHLIVGVTDHWQRAPIAETARSIRSGLDAFATAVDLGYPAHVWDIHDWFSYAVAVDHRVLADRLIALRREAWDTDRVRPVNWLVLRLLVTMALYRRDDHLASWLLVDLQTGTFATPLPSELEPDLPLMRNWYWLLSALQRRSAEDFNRHLAERMDLRAAHFRHVCAPIALCDLHGLALCRFARERDLPITVAHVYLPLDLLDVPAGHGS